MSFEVGSYTEREPYIPIKWKDIRKEDCKTYWLDVEEAEILARNILENVNEIKTGIR